MKKSLLLFSVLTAGLTSFSQITVTDADLPNPDDTVMVSISNQYTTIDFSTTGANQTWDYSSLVANSQKIDTFYSVTSASALYQLSFNNAFTAPEYASDYYRPMAAGALPAIPGGAVTITNPVYFTKNSSTKSENVGIGLEINGVETPVQADTIDMIYQYPMNYNDAWTSRSYMYIDMNPAINAMFKRNQLRESQVDGWGQITTPFGTFDAIRVKSTITYTDSIYFDLGFGGSWSELTTPQDIEYTWWTNNNKIPVLLIVEQNGTATKIEYRDKKIDFVGVENNTDVKETFKVYPNPANSEVSIVLNDTELSTIEIVDVTGKIIYTNKINNTTQINVSDWEKGVYIVRLISNNKVTTQSLIVE